MLKVRLLGQFEVSVDGQPLAMASRPAQALLAHLLLTAGTPHRREQLAAIFWPEAPDRNARSNLRHTLWVLRSALGGAADCLLVDAQTAAFDPAADYWLDTDALQQEFSGDWPAEELMECVSVYAGELLPGFDYEWAALERDRLRASYERQMQLLLDRLTADSRWTDLRQWAERWIAAGGAPEPAFRALMRGCAAQGDMAGLAAVYQRCRDALSEQLGLDPSPQTRDLYTALLRGDPATETARAAQPPPAEKPAPAPSHNLPAALTGFFGREAQLAELARLWRDPNCRLVTLAGTGGIGKTRLSLQAAWAALGEFRDGVFFVPLAPVSSPDLIVPAVAGAMGVSFYGGVDQTDQLLAHLRPRNLMLVLDNFEHLIAGAGLVQRLLENAPGLKCLVTSRERLNLRGEWAISLDGLSLPERDEILAPEGYAAIQLFMQSARRVQADFVLRSGEIAKAVRICRLVEGLPLAIELAAAWVRALPLGEIAAEIERALDFLSTTFQDVPSRHRSMRAVFDHSWNLLSADEQRVLAWLSVFRGGFTRPTAEAAAGATLAVLTGMMDKSLVRRSGDRYFMHELLRQYALDKLRDAGAEAPARAAHLSVYQALAEAAEPALRGSDQLAWLARLDEEHDNLRAALQWALTDEQLEAGLRLAGGLARFWYLRGHWPEGREWLGKFLAMLEPDSVSPSVNAAAIRALCGAGWLSNESSDETAFYSRALALARSLGDRWHEAYALRGLGGTIDTLSDSSHAADRLAESLSVFGELKDTWGTALARFNLGWASMYHGAQDVPTAHWEASLEGFRQSGDRWGQAVSLGALSYAARFVGDYRRAAVLSKEALQLFTELGDQAGVSDSLSRQASVAYRRSDYSMAVDLYRESLAIAQALDDRWDVAQITGVLGMISVHQGRAEEGLRLIDAAIETGGRLVGRHGVAFLVSYRGQACFSLGRLDEAERAWAESLSAERAGDDRVAAGYSLHYLGLVALQRGELDKAGASLGESHDLLHTTQEKRGVAIAHYGLGRLAAARGQNQDAISWFQLSLRLRHEMGDRLGQAEALEGLGLSWQSLDAERSARLLAGAGALRERIGAPLPIPDGAGYDRAVSSARTQIGETRFQAAWQGGWTARLDDVVDEALRPAGP